MSREKKVSRSIFQLYMNEKKVQYETIFFILGEVFNALVLNLILSLIHSQDS